MRWAGVVGALLAMALLAGCTSKDVRLYRRAEAFFAQGQFQVAAEEYGRLAAEHPHSELADDALYKLGYILAEELDQPNAALAQYWALADNYPRSPYADDALMRVMAIQRRVLHDPAAVRATHDELCRRFADRPVLCARGLLEVGRAYFDAEDYEQALKVAVELTEAYPQQPQECAQADLLRARCAERLGVDSAEVEKLYEVIIERYPNTHAAAAAKREIGWRYFEKRAEHAQQAAEEIKRRSRVIGGVPPYAAQRGEVLQALAALGALLAHRGESRSLETLMGLAGAPFVAVCDLDRPGLGRSVLDVDPFEAVAEALGFAYNTMSSPTAEQAFESLHQSLLQGRPVLVLYGSPRRWVIVTGYDLAAERVSFMPPDHERYATAGRELFLRAWAQGSRHDSGLAGPEPFRQFSLSARTTEPAATDLTRTMVRRAAEVLSAASIAGAPAGEAAWEALAAHLEQCAAPDGAPAREQVRKWIADGLVPQLALMEQGVAVLRDAAGAVPGLGEAAARYQELVAEVRLIAQKTDEAASADEEIETKWRAAAAQASYVAALHARLAEQLATAARE